MDLDREILGMIEQYVADALATTGTRKARPAALPLVKLPAAPDLEGVEGVEADVAIDVESEVAIEVDEDDILIPIEIELEPATVFSAEEETAWMAPAFHPAPDPIPVLSRVRAARGSTPPSDTETEVELDDEITNLVGKPTP